MMTLKNVKDWMQKQIQAQTQANWKIGIYDSSKQKTICVCNLTSNRSKLAIGGLANTNTSVKGVSIVIHWTKNPDETECIAQAVHGLFYGKQPIISGYQTVLCEMRSDEPISVGTDEQGVYEYVIEVWITYMRDRKEG